MLLDLIENRKSVREYLEKDISNDDLKKILKAGYLAPSWMNSQPWKFILVKNQDTKELLSQLSGNQPHVKNANALIVCIADKNGWSKEEFGKVLAARGIGESGREKIFNIPMFYPPLLGEDKVLLRTVEQVTYAVSYMMLEAKDLGIDSCIIGAISNEATVKNDDLIEKVNKVLNLNNNEVIITIITLGYAKENTPSNKIRKDFDEIVHFEKKGNKLTI